MGSPKHVYGTVCFGEVDWTVVSAGASAFNNCVSLQTVDLPMAATVGDQAFHYCDALEYTKQWLCDSVNRKTLGKQA
ncbi:MAG: hypothetical protein E7Z68_04500 [Thermoplasmata archaeon]|nr:hypothetical protein [Thermoplasmata archaeon]